MWPKGTCADEAVAKNRKRRVKIVCLILRDLVFDTAKLRYLPQSHFAGHYRNFAAGYGLAGWRVGGLEKMLLINAVNILSLK